LIGVSAIINKAGACTEERHSEHEALFTYVSHTKKHCGMKKGGYNVRIVLAVFTSSPFPHRANIQRYSDPAADRRLGERRYTIASKTN